MGKGKQCANCKHVEITHYKQTAKNKLPDVLIGQCKVPFCVCTGFESKSGEEK
jgi:hypothetical protein